MKWNPDHQKLADWGAKGSSAGRELLDSPNSREPAKPSSIKNGETGRGISPSEHQPSETIPRSAQELNKEIWEDAAWEDGAMETTQKIVNENPDSIEIGNSKTGVVKIYFDGKHPEEGERKLEVAIGLLLKHREAVLGAV